MAALWLRFRVEMRARWRAVLVLGVVAGLGAGAVLTGLAGSRRTDDAYERMLEATDAPDFVVRPGSGVGLPFDRSDIAALPGVARVAEVAYFYLTTQGPRETLVDRPSVLASGSVSGGAYSEIGRPKVVEGRLPRPDRPNEILVSRLLEREGDFHLGDASHLVVVVPDETQPGGIRFQNVDFRIVGVGVTPDQIAVDERRQGGLQMLLTPAFVREHRADAVETSLQVRLRPGADRRSFPREVRSLAGSQALDVVSTTDDRERVDRAIRPQVVALWIFAGFVALALLLVLSQAIGRQLFLDSVDDGTLRALGLSRRQRVLLGLLRIAPIAVVAMAVALVTAIAASPLMPIGPARIAEPDPGEAFDLLVVGLGAVAVVLVILAVAVLPARRLARRPLLDGAGSVSARHPRSRLAAELASLGAPPTVVAGTRFALEPGRGPTGVPTRATLTGAAAAATALIAAIVVASNLQHLVDTPMVWGATWNLTVAVAADPRELGDEFDLETVLAAKEQYVAERLDRSPDVAAWSIATVNTVELGGRAIPALGIDPDGTVGPAVVEGRVPRRAEEVALGRRTSEQLGVEIGDRVPAAGGSLRLVGTTVLPKFQAVGGGDEAALNRGAVLTLDSLLGRSTDFYTRSYLVRLEPGVSQPAARRRLADEIPPPFAFDISAVSPPQDIEAIGRVTGTPVVLAALLGGLALATLVHALATSVRRRRRDLAILVALGFTRRQVLAQVAATVAWQASIVTVFALVVALPAGIVAGRWLAGVFSNQLGAVSDLVVPLGTLGLLVVAALALANVVAFVPGRLAARLQPATVLRSE